MMRPLHHFSRHKFFDIPFRADRTKQTYNAWPLVSPI